MSSMSCSRNDVVLLPIPFTDLTSRKVRPAVVIGRRGTDLFLVPISWQSPNTDFGLAEWRAAGLNVPCGVKTGGSLKAVDQAKLDERLRLWLQL
jgi:mRNA interferase MazF